MGTMCRWFAAACLLSSIAAAGAADPDKPHRHQGLVAPYPEAPPVVHLSLEERERLDNARPLYKRLPAQRGARAVAVFRVDAPPRVVWSVITDFASYPQWIDNLAETTVYRREDDDYYVRFEVDHWLTGRYVYFVRHRYPYPKTSWGTWKLDYSRDSDIADSVGFWRVIPVPGDPDRSEITYSADIVLDGVLASLLKNTVVDRGIREATVWVKEQAERRFAGN